jgi:hypothetical protein
VNYIERKPRPALLEYLECFWFASSQAEPAGSLERVLPDGCLEWIFHLGAPFRRLNAEHEWEMQPRSFVVGELTRFILLQPTGPVATMGVRFRPGGAYRFLPFPVAGRGRPGNDLRRDGAEDLKDRLRLPRLWPGREGTETFVIPRVRCFNRPEAKND